MNVIAEKNNGQVVLKVEGRVDTVTSPALEKHINNVAPEAKELVLDLAGVEYVSSAGLRVLLAAQKKMAKVGSMKLVNVCETVMEVFEITGFVDILTIE